MPVDKTRINWNVLFRAIRSYSVIVHRELIDDLFLHERKLQFLHCKTTTSWAISTRKSGRPTCNKDPPIQPYSTPFYSIVHIKKINGEKTNHHPEKVLFLLAALIPALIFGGKTKSSRTPDNKKE